MGYQDPRELSDLPLPGYLALVVPYKCGNELLRLRLLFYAFDNLLRIKLFSLLFFREYRGPGPVVV